MENQSFENVIPILDYGTDPDSKSYYVVMAKAESSLRDYIKTAGLPDNDAVDVLMQIANGLKEASFLIHRDLKPDNVLLHEGKWKITDFGIAKFVEKSTSLKTLKDCLSAPYAAPEQWRLESSVNNTDELIINIGAGIAVKKDIKYAKTLVDNQINEIATTETDLIKGLQNLEINFSEIEREVKSEISNK